MFNKNFIVICLSSMISAFPPMIVVLLGGIITSKIMLKDSLATLPMTLMIIGIALSAPIASKLMSIWGRKKGFIFSSFLSTFALLLCSLSIYNQNFIIFAVGNFLLTAIRNEKICLYSNTNIIRSYGYAGEIAASGLGLLYLNKFSKKKSILDCASHTINLLELAKKISKLYKLPLVDSNIDFSLEENKYTCDIKAFRTLLVELNIEPITLEKQIEITYNYIKKMS